LRQCEDQFAGILDESKQPITSNKGETPMSVPTSEVALKDYLFNHDAQFRELVTEHRKYDERLTELTSLLHPNEDELIEEAILKKKKLYLKDQMEQIAIEFKSVAAGH
jgi:uncharacterized protein YdcH (DUF465 family)